MARRIRKPKLNPNQQVELFREHVGGKDIDDVMTYLEDTYNWSTKHVNPNAKADGTTQAESWLRQQRESALQSVAIGVLTSKGISTPDEIAAQYNAVPSEERPAKTDFVRQLCEQNDIDWDAVESYVPDIAERDGTGGGKKAKFASVTIDLDAFSAA